MSGVRKLSSQDNEDGLEEPLERISTTALSGRLIRNLAWPDTKRLAISDRFFSQMLLFEP